MRSDKTQELKVLTDSKPKADKPVGGSLPEESRAKNVDDAASHRTQSDTDVKAAAAMAGTVACTLAQINVDVMIN